jgi:hypothetical protein
VDIARSDHRLVPTHFVFYDEEHEIFCIGSEEAGICLADVVSCSWQINEVVASVILSEVKPGLQSSYHAHPKSSKIVQALHNLSQQGIQYKSVKASNIYLSAVKDRDGKVISYRVQLGELKIH